MELEGVVPWGRSFAEYKKMFSLSANDLDRKILGCGDGPACFNAELTKAGGDVVSVDPIYQFNGQEIYSRINDVYPQVRRIQPVTATQPQAYQRAFENQVFFLGAY